MTLHHVQYFQPVVLVTPPTPTNVRIVIISRQWRVTWTEITPPANSMLETYELELQSRIRGSTDDDWSNSTPHQTSGRALNGFAGNSSQWRARIRSRVSYDGELVTSEYSDWVVST